MSPQNHMEADGNARGPKAGGPGGLADGGRVARSADAPFSAHAPFPPQTMRELSRLAEAYGDRSVQEDVAFIAEQLVSQSVSVAALGQFKRGKSTLLNALLGAHLLPTGQLPLTGIVTRLIYSERRDALVHYQDGRNESVALDALASYVTEEGNPRNERGVAYVDVLYPSPLLRDMILLDTPGIGSTLTHNTRAAREAAGRIDLALFVTGPEPPITQEELEFLRTVRGLAERCIVVVAKIDRAGDGAQQILAFTQRALAQLSEKVDLYAVNSMREDAGIDEIRRAVLGIVEGSGRVLVQRSRARRILRATTLVRQGIELRRAALLLPRRERERAQAQYAKLVEDVQDRADDLVHAIDRFPSEEMCSVDDLLRNLYEAAVVRISAGVEGLVSSKSAQEGEDGLYLQIASVEGEWFQQVAASLDDRIEHRESAILRRTSDLESRFAEAGCAALGLQAAPREAGAQVFGRREAATRMRGPMPTTGLEIVAGMLVAALPGPLRARALRRRYGQLIPNLLDRSRGRVRSAALGYLNDWRYIYRAQVAERLGLARRVVEDAFADASRGSDDGDTQRRLHVLERDEKRVAEIVAALA